MQKIIHLLSNRTYRNYTLAAGMLCVCALIIWFVGPHLSFAGHRPLAKTDKRLFAITLLALCWVLKIILVDAKPKLTLPVATVTDPAIATQLEMLQQRLLGAIQFLTKTTIKKNGHSVRLNQLPWYLVVGTSDSGKTSMLANSNINFILDKPNSLNHAASDTCDWWATRDAVLVDVPGSYLENTSGGSMLYHLAELIGQARGENAVRGVVMALSLSEIMDRKQREKMVGGLKNNITQLRSRFGSDLPFYFTITKCDLLPGFQDFFSDCGSDELAQAWGITLPNMTSADSIVDIGINRFDALINRLNKQLIWRLHQERNNYARIYIKDFPLQVERLKEAFIDVLKSITRTGDDLTLKGIYLTSAMQNQTPEQSAAYPQTVSGDDFQRSMEIMNTFVMRKQAYFIKQFILQGILQSNPVPVNNNNWNSGALVSAAVACLVILMGGLEGKTILNDFNQNTDTLNTSTDLAQNQLQTTLETVSIQPVPLVASAALNPKELASLKPGNISNQRKEDRV